MVNHLIHFHSVRDPVGGFMKYNAGINAGWRTGYMTGGSRDSGGGTFTAYDGQTFGIKYPDLPWY